MIMVPADFSMFNKDPSPGLQPVAFSQCVHTALLFLGTPGPIFTQPLWGLRLRQMSFEGTQHSVAFQVCQAEAGGSGM